MTNPLRERSSLNRWTWIGLLGGASIGFSAVFACATPFVALATLAAIHMDRRDGVIVVFGAWLANQAIGYGILGYPHSADSYAWGIAIGLAALLALAAGRTVAAGLASAGTVSAMAAAFIAAFVVYELALYVASFWLPSSEAAFSLRVVAYILQVNVFGLAALLILRWIAELVGIAPISVRPRIAAD